MSNTLTDGDQLGPYTIQRALGAGAAGQVYLACHAILRQPHAIKVLHAQHVGKEVFEQRFFREARLAAELDHPGIVRVITAGEEDNLYYLVMEFIDGPSLEDLIVEQGPMAPGQAVRYLIDILDGLHYAHHKGVLHRDIKAENILIDSDERPRIVDFGLVLDVEGKTRVTAHDAVVGTPYYMPVEQWMSEPVDAGADIYAAGVLLFYLLSGDFPYPGDTPLQVLYRLKHEKPQPLTLQPIHGVDPGARDELRRRLTEIVERATAYERAARFTTAGEFADALRHWLSDALP